MLSKGKRNKEGRKEGIKEENSEVKKEREW